MPCRVNACVPHRYGAAMARLRHQAYNDGMIDAKSSHPAATRGFIISAPTEDGNRFIVPLAPDGSPVASPPVEPEPEGA